MQRGGDKANQSLGLSREMWGLAGRGLLPGIKDPYSAERPPSQSATAHCTPFVACLFVLANSLSSLTATHASQNVLRQC
jgi:hypothetical protein